MANPRQRSKAKSHKSTKPSLAQKKRMHAKLKKAPPLRGPETLQKAWDKKKTVFQNYAALGLLPSIPIPSSGSRVQLPLLPPGAAPTIGFGRIVRDDDGNVIDIIIDGEEDEDEGHGQPQPLNEEEEEPEKIVAKTQVVRDLEALAATSAPVVRHTSSQEHVWLAELVRAHGDDYTDMARDRKRNVWQKTPGEIRRMVKKAGGVDVLRRMEV
ncbi:hypothetical protein CspeluHIS016_0701120 [Cutaneotrichosporon spelunceum]|uniref:Nucleolar protein 16 n=1 Tax=Cutaneotrichosporon spelunceum TaxID=1672016 RepID=A0AAD3TZ76_9TREE|nr:hypothetical protein CspeluHIS016_0701120 [Cutaneotrichosporon spelunceum]